MGKTKIVIPAKAQRARRQREHEKIAAQQYAIHLRFNRRNKSLDFTLRNGAIVRIPILAIRELAHATPAQLAEVKLYATGGAIEQRELDVDLSVPGLLRDIFGFELQQSRAARVKTPKKAAAARANGAKGGRPRTVTAA